MLDYIINIYSYRVIKLYYTYLTTQNKKWLDTASCKYI